MNPALRLRAMTIADLPFADSARALAGWNQTLEDWQRFLAVGQASCLSPLTRKQKQKQKDRQGACPTAGGCFVAEWEGVLAGTATTTIYSRDLAWIGMVLVRPDFRRRGIGQALLEHCIEHLHARGVNCIKLDATPLGKSVYDQLEFKDEWTLSRWECARLAPFPPATNPRVRIRNWRDDDARVTEPLDRAAFGVSRKELLRPLAKQSRTALICDRDGMIDGFAFVRDGARASYLGPVVAANAEVGTALIETALARHLTEPIFWDIPDANTAAIEWARAHGFAVQRQLIRMHLGENRAPGDPRKQFALAGPEVG